MSPDDLDPDVFISVQAEDLKPLFEKYGDVGDVYLPLERGTGRSRGFAFIRYLFPLFPFI